MAEYIKRYDAMKICQNYSTHCFSVSDAKGQDVADKIEDEIVEIPTADVVEVKHGKWEKLKYLGNCINPCQHTCGVCGKSYFDDNHNNYPFCPLCGAKMDVSKKEITT